MKKLLFIFLLIPLLSGCSNTDYFENKNYVATFTYTTPSGDVTQTFKPEKDTEIIFDNVSYKLETTGDEIVYNGDAASKDLVNIRLLFDNMSEFEEYANNYLNLIGDDSEYSKDDLLISNKDGIYTINDTNESDSFTITIEVNNDEK